VKEMIAVLGLVGVAALAVAPRAAVAQIAKNVAAKSPWGPADEIGTLNNQCRGITYVRCSTTALITCSQCSQT
jgi:hypothetical protein